MNKDDGTDKLKMIIPKVAKLGWVQTINTEPYMHLADVEKTIIALFDDFEMSRIDNWVKNIPKPERLPELKILESEQLKRIVESQRKMLGSMMRKEACIFKECPFPNIPRAPAEQCVPDITVQ